MKKIQLNEIKGFSNSNDSITYLNMKKIKLNQLKGYSTPVDNYYINSIIGGFQELDSQTLDKSNYDDNSTSNDESLERDTSNDHDSSTSNDG